MENKDRTEIFRSMPKTSRHRYRLQEPFSHEPSPRLYPQGNRTMAEVAVFESGGKDKRLETRAQYLQGCLNKPSTLRKTHSIPHFVSEESILIAFQGIRQN